VEFAVQLLQLVHGRTDESLRSGTTIPRWRPGRTEGYVGREDARHLAEAYRWLRTVEHRAAAAPLRRTHLLPARRRGGLRGGRVRPATADAVATFTATVRLRREVRRLHEKLFYRRCSAPWRGCPANRRS
jgi:glutamate-ammonia-ligase adenylyltransferase